jgi:ubiquinone/menaquinone biosynthesis C-methylase UbiE
LADNLLELARAKAERRLLKNILFHNADMLSLPYPDESFDAFIRDHGIDRLPTNALYAVATKKE